MQRRREGGLVGSARSLDDGNHARHPTPSWGRSSRGLTWNLLLWSVSMQDLGWVVVTIVFFALSIAYVHFCEHVR